MQVRSAPNDLTSLSATSPLNNAATDPHEPPFPSPLSSSRTYKTKNKSDAQSRQDRATAIQPAKREILANVREDWTWPLPPTQVHSDRFPRRRRSTQWREREEDSPPAVTRSPSPSIQDPYKFETPDAVAATVPPSRKRKLNDDEVDWNTGLRVYTERRDYWTAAEKRSSQKNPRRVAIWPSDSASNPSSGTEPRNGTPPPIPQTHPSKPEDEFTSSGSSNSNHSTTTLSTSPTSLAL
ncbi:MAG: hypothetical protein Q9218_004952, partial [Villophora microphyllina]